MNRFSIRLEKVGKFLSSMFSSNQTISWTRTVGFLIIVDILTVWTVACIANRQYISIPWSDASILIAALTGKVVQSFSENGYYGDKS